MSDESSSREYRRFELGVIVSLIGLTVTILVLAFQGGERLGRIDSRLTSLEHAARTDMPPGPAREIAALKAWQASQDQYRDELNERLGRIESTQAEILRELRRGNSR